jgi:hypothetical protein
MKENVTSRFTYVGPTHKVSMSAPSSSTYQCRNTKLCTWEQLMSRENIIIPEHIEKGEHPNLSSNIDRKQE